MDNVAVNEIDEASELIVNALRPNLGKLSTIYRFASRRSLPQLTALLLKWHTAFGLSTVNPVTELSDWLNTVQLINPMINELRIPPESDQFGQTLRLRALLHGVLKTQYPCTEEMTLAMRGEIAQWVVISWGGVDRKAPKKEEGAIQRAEKYTSLVRKAEKWGVSDSVESHSLGSYANVAQWSKYLAFRHPQRAAIFDARVAYSMNWYLRSAAVARRFPVLPSMNSLLRLLDHSALVAGTRLTWPVFERAIVDEIGLLESGTRQKSRVRRITDAPAHVIPPKSAYGYYLKILRSVAVKLFGDDEWGLTKTEMMLFGLATTRVVGEVAQKLCANRSELIR